MYIQCDLDGFWQFLPYAWGECNQESVISFLFDEGQVCQVMWTKYHNIVNSTKIYHSKNSRKYHDRKKYHYHSMMSW